MENFNFNRRQEQTLTPESVLESTKVSKLVWEANKKNGVRVEWKPDQWHGYSRRNGVIEVGMQPVPENIKKLWGISSFSDEFARAYILSHESMHHVLWNTFDDPENFPEVRKLLNSLATLRQNTQLGLSRLGNMKIYDAEGSNTMHEEDCVELMNMYGIGPQVLREYLDWLTNTDEQILREQKLYKLPSRQAADAFFYQVSITIAKFLKNSGVISKIA